MAVTPIVYGLAQVPSAACFFVSQSSPFSRPFSTRGANSFAGTSCFFSSGFFSWPWTAATGANHIPRTKPTDSMRERFIAGYSF